MGTCIEGAGAANSRRHAGEVRAGACPGVTLQLVYPELEQASLFHVSDTAECQEAKMRFRIFLDGCDVPSGCGYLRRAAVKVPFA